MHALVLLAPLTVSGVVSDATSRWTGDGSRIITEATVSTASGDVVVSQLGGTVDGVTMRTFPAIATPLERGMYVDVLAHVDVVQDVGSFVRTGPTKAGHYLYWESGCIFVTPDSAGTTAVPFATAQNVIAASIATWNTDVDTASCSFIKVMTDAPKAVEVGK